MDHDRLIPGPLTRAISVLKERGNPEDLAQAEEYQKALNTP